jgi:RimJ/RimL family protein N-acetyltransferase
VTSWSSSSEPGGLRTRRLDRRDREAAFARVARSPRDNLLLLDLTAHIGLPPAPGEGRADLVGVWDGDALAAVASVRPSVLIDAAASPAAVEALAPWLQRLEAGLIKSAEAVVGACWPRLLARGRRPVVDRTETACAVEPASAFLISPPDEVQVRPAVAADLPELVHAARASLREEGRPDPFTGDPDGFRRWVRGRVPRATVVDVSGRIGFVGYADVQRPEGWLLQGVYTWPELRRRGLAAVGVSALCRAAFEAGADHAQLAVVDGNAPAERLYSKLGFKPFARLRTILFG